MALAEKMVIHEFRDIVRGDGGESIMAPDYRTFVAEQVIDFTVAVAAQTLDGTTRYVMMFARDDLHYAQGAAGATTATVDNMPMAAGERLFIGIKGGNDISAISD